MTSKNFFTVALTTVSIGIALLFSATASSLPQPIEERIVTDTEMLFFGVPIDYSYNETQPDITDSYSSAPGCPKSDVGYPWVYFGSPPKCYLAGTRGPCNEVEKLLVKSGSHFGFCSCECIDGIELINPLDDQFCKPSSVGTLEFVHVADLEKCFAIHEQGPCREDEWIVKSVRNKTDNGEKTYCQKRTYPAAKFPFKSDDGDQGGQILFNNQGFSGFGIVNDKCESTEMRFSKLRNMCVRKLKLSI